METRTHSLRLGVDVKFIIFLNFEEQNLVFLVNLLSILVNGDRAIVKSGVQGLLMRRLDLGLKA